MENFDLTEAITVITSVFALLFAFLSWYNQVRSKLSVGANPVVLSNNPIVSSFPSTQKGKLWIANVGYKSITVIDINLKIRKQKISWKSYFGDINIFVNPGETKYFEYDTSWVAQCISNGNFNSEDIICWEFVTATNKKITCKTSNKVSDVIDINKKGARIRF